MRAIARLAFGAVWLLLAAPLLAGAGPRARANATLLQTLPAPVQRTIRIEIANGVLDDVSRTNSDDGDVIYDVNFSRAGKPRNLTVALDGRLLDMKVYLPEAPPAVRESLKSLSQAGELGEITRDFGLNEDSTFDAEITHAGITRTYTVDDCGVVLGTQVFLGELPARVKDSVNSIIGAGTAGEITKQMDDDGVTYEVVMTRGGTNRTFTVNTNGEMLEEQVFLDEIPGAVQKAVQAQAKWGRLGKINKSTDGGTDYYEVEIRIGLNTCRLAFTAEGKPDSEEEDMVLASAPARVKTALRSIQRAGEVVTDVMRSTEGSDTTYDIELRDGKTRRTLTFDPDGVLVKN